jgi:hypothetical protein
MIMGTARSSETSADFYQASLFLKTVFSTTQRTAWHSGNTRFESGPELWPALLVVFLSTSCQVPGLYFG